MRTIGLGYTRDRATRVHSACNHEHSVHVTAPATGETKLSSSTLHWVVHCLSYCSLALFMDTIHGHCSHGFYKSNGTHKKNDPRKFGASQSMNKRKMKEMLTFISSRECTKFELQTFSTHSLLSFFNSLLHSPTLYIFLHSFIESWGTIKLITRSHVAKQKTKMILFLYGHVVCHTPKPRLGE